MKHRKLSNPMLIMKFMRTYSLIAFLFFSFTASATNYYISNSGNDDNSGTSISNPWKTIVKVNAANFKAGDSILFKMGDTFYGSLNISKSGTSENPIVFSSYGTGDKPVITGFTTISGWTNLGGGIWSITDNSLPSMVNLLTINNVIQPLGRWPKNKNNTYQSSTGNTSIRDNQLTGINWAGGELVMRKYAWILDRNIITSNSGYTINYTASTSNPPIDGSEYFIQNQIHCLTTFGDWCYVTSTHTLSMYFGTELPSNYAIKVSKISRLISIDNGYYYNTFQNLNFEGANDDAAYFNVASNCKIINCDFNKMGKNAVRLIWSKNVSVLGNTFTDVLNNAIISDFVSTGATVSGNTLLRTGLIQGAGQSGDNTYQGITVYGDSSLVEYNNIDSTGYNAIAFYGNNTIVNRNFINHFNSAKQDGGGIYTWNANFPVSPYTGQKITNNIILNGSFDTVGVKRNFGRYVHGIYLDVGAANIEIFGNTLANNDYSGIFVHDDRDIYIHNNLLLNNLMPIRLLSDNEPYAGTSQIVAQNNIKIRKNIFFAKDIGKLNFHFSSTDNDLGSFGSVDSNYYITTSDKYDFYTEKDSMGKKIWDAYDFSKWKLTSPYDVNSKKVLLAAPKYSVNNLIGGNKFTNESFNSNITNVPWVYNCLKSWDNTNKIDNGALKITQKSPLSSSWNASFVKLSIGAITNTKNYIVRWSMKGSTNGVIGILLNENYDVNDPLTQYQYLPLSSQRTENEILFSMPASSNDATLEFMFRDQDGVVWLDNVEVFEAEVTVKDDSSRFYYNSSLSDTVISLDGSYKNVYGEKFNGSITLAPFTSTILLKNSDINDSLPKAFAGSDQIITLPINSADFLGHGTSPMGTISIYDWSKISGPSAGTISNMKAATTSVTGLTQGTYQFELKVTDNAGAVGKDTIQIIVNPVANIPPVAKAGYSQTITLPLNSASLSGNGTDADGTVISYLWNKISGPAFFSVVNANSSLTDVTGLIQGVYQFELKVTDNNGAVGKDTIQVTVNPAIIIPITANTGPDQTIILPVNTVNLSGSGTGPIIAYQWRQLSGPSTVMYSIDLATASISGLIRGVYQFELKVLDNNNLSERDTMKVNVYPEANTLPLSWQGVQAQWINESEAKVSWQVAQQQNVKDYTVQYSSDANNFINACSVISSAITSYNCIIVAYNNTKSYFRVMQTDIDGKKTYSKIILLQPSTKPVLSVYPNPAQDKLYLRGIGNFSEAIISDAGGSTINHFSPGANTEYMDISKLVKGIYFIKLVSVNDTQTIKFIKE